MRILCVCLGNICRSPAAETILREKIRRKDLDYELDSAGTSGFHEGEPADSRMTEALRKKGYQSTCLSRQVTSRDFTDFDLILAMDHSNFENLVSACPAPELKSKVHLFCEFGLDQDLIVPDPYYGGLKGFSEVIELVEEASDGIIRKLVGA